MKNIRNIFQVGIILLSSLLFESCFRANTSDQDQKKQEVASEHDKDLKGKFNIHSLEDLYTFLSYDDNQYPLISAHRGGPYQGFPENAIETFANIASKMPAIIECDIRMSKDSVLLLMHDETLNRTTTGNGKISNTNWEEISRLKLVDNEKQTTPYKVPTLEEALEWGKGKVIYTLDVKHDVPYELVVEAIRQTEAEASVVVITYSANQAAVVHRLASDLMISASVKGMHDLQRLKSLGVPADRIVAFVGTSEAEQKVYKSLHDAKVKTILGTLGNIDRSAKQNGYQIYAELVDRGADILSTDRPIEAYQGLKYYIDKRQISSPYINQ